MWIFIDVPPSEVELARHAGAVLHRKRQQWFFDDSVHDESNFARWKRIDATALRDGIAMPSSREKADLSLHAVSHLTGHTPKLLRALIDCGRFPKPIDSSGVSSRSDRWSRAQVHAFVDTNGFGGLASLRFDDAGSATKDDDTGIPSFISMGEIAREVNVVPLGRLFQMLREGGVLISSEHLHDMNRPTEEYMRKGWFGRVERHLPPKNQRIYQTVVTAAGRKEVVALIRKLLESSRR